MGHFTTIIIDDSNTIRMMLASILQHVGCQVVATANDGIEGVEVYKQYRPDIAFVDINMPNLDGYDTIRQIKAFNPAAYTVMMTGAGDFFSEGNAKQAGANTYIEKDLGNMNFQAKLMEILNSVQ